MALSRLQLTSVTIGAPQPRELARFYARLLAGEITADNALGERAPVDDGWAQMKTRSDFCQITLNFEYEANWREPIWPSEPDVQHITQHLDIRVEDLESAVSWAVECGARLDPYQPQESVRVMRDPAGHPFCLYLGG